MLLPQTLVMNCSSLLGLVCNTWGKGLKTKKKRKRLSYKIYYILHEKEKMGTMKKFDFSEICLKGAW